VLKMGEFRCAHMVCGTDYSFLPKRPKTTYDFYPYAAAMWAVQPSENR
jgi:hypothetical protein